MKCGALMGYTYYTRCARCRWYTSILYMCLERTPTWPRSWGRYGVPQYTMAPPSGSVGVWIESMDGKLLCLSRVNTIAELYIVCTNNGMWSQWLWRSIGITILSFYFALTVWELRNITIVNNKMIHSNIFGQCRLCNGLSPWESMLASNKPSTSFLLSV